MENRQSRYVRILGEICDEENIAMSSYSSDWAFCLKKNGKRAFILGYQFGLNLSSVQQICRDKNITSEVLREEGIPSVYHSCFMTPVFQSYVGADGNWRELIRLLEKYKTLVCKDNYGTGGNQVYLARNARELEYAANEIFRVSEAMAVCPYEEIEEECRLVLLDGSIRLAFRKLRREIRGDGIHTLGELYGQAVSDGSAAGCTVPRVSELGRIPEKEERILLNWKHNLGQGAVSEELDETCLPKEMTSLAERVREALQIRFASIDLIRVKQKDCGNREDSPDLRVASSAGQNRFVWKVLEVNSGVMMEHFASESPEHYKKAKEIYRDAVLRMLS